MYYELLVHVLDTGAVSEHGRSEEFLFSSWALRKIKKLMRKNGGGWVGQRQFCTRTDFLIFRKLRTTPYVSLVLVACIPFEESARELVHKLFRVLIADDGEE